MNRSRVIVLVAAAFAAGLVALLMRGLLGGGTEKTVAAPAPRRIATTEVLVASNDIAAGTELTPQQVRWQSWPKSSVDSTLITQDEAPDLSKEVAGTVVRSPMVAGEPLTDSKFVHAGAVGFMAARLSPGTRAVSISISAESGAGGFILPNDRVDVLLTTQISDSPRRFATRTLLPDVRVLAVDQTYAEDKSQKVVVGKTATLELLPRQTETVARAAASGTLSLSLRALGDSNPSKALVAAAAAKQLKQDPSSANASANGSTNPNDDGSYGGGVSVIRYGVSHANANQAGE